MRRETLAAFMDELVKIAASEEIYDPAVTAHEAGHAYMHGLAKWDPIDKAELAGTLGSMAGVNAARFMKSPHLGLYGAAAGFAPRLVDEYGASIKGMSALKDRLSEEDQSRARKRLALAGGTYAMVPTQLAALGALSQYGDEIKNKALRRALAGTALVGPTAAGLGMYLGMLKMRGPRKVDVGEVRDIVEDVAPGTEVYTSKKPISAGSAYLAPSRTKAFQWLAKAQIGPYMHNLSDAGRIAERGGVLMAPLTDSPVTTMLKAQLAPGEVEERFKRVQ